MSRHVRNKLAEAQQVKRLLSKKWLLTLSSIFTLLIIFLMVGIQTGVIHGQTIGALIRTPQTKTTADATAIHHDTAALKTITNNPKLTVTMKQQALQTSLQKYLNQVGADGNVAVSFYNLTPEAGSTAANANDAPIYAEGKLAANVNGADRRVAASTYKLFISAYLFNQVANGRTWTSADETGFTEMIVDSANDYSESQLATYGADTLNAYYQQLGWSAVFSNADDTPAATSTNDLVALLKKLQAGTAPFNQDFYQEKLLTDMSTQVYRDGIPAAVASLTPDATVQDKVGWYEDYNNDAAIVTLPDGQRYLLAIMTKGVGYMDFSEIATIAQKVQQIVYGN